MENTLYTIGDIAKATGEEVPTIRFWMQEGLITAAGKTVGGYFLFTEETVKRAKRIRELKKRNHYTLAGIKEALHNDATN